ncbi:MFS transporter [Streptomyces sp. NPDC058107]|uniref:MFS transporter n=1 Tax=Streptomyces sp. NPDC058107 TaxID=3346343 RepID=UPI0036EA1F61
MTAVRDDAEVAPSARVRAVVGVLVAFELFSGFVQGADAPLLPAVQDEWGVSAADAQWFMTVHLLAAAVSVPVLGRLGDLYGHRRLLRIALGCVTAGTLLVFLAPTYTVALVGRALMGAIGSLLALEIGLVRGRLDASGARRAIGLLVAALTLGALLGSALSGALLGIFGGVRVAFAALAVLGLVCTALAWWCVPESGPRGAGRMDWAGAVLLGLALVVLLGAMSRADAWGVASPRLAGALLLAAVLGWAWLRLQLARPDALVDVRAMARRALAPHYAAGFVLGAVLLAGQSVAVMFLAAEPTEGEYGFGLAVWQIGLWSLIPSVLGLVASALAPAIGARIGYRRMLVSAFALMAIGHAGLILAHANLGLFVAAYSVAGFGIGLSQGGLPTVIAEGSAHDRAASATAAYNTLKTLGGGMAGAGASVILGALVVGASDTPSLTAYLTLWGLGVAACTVAVALQTGGGRETPGCRR